MKLTLKNSFLLALAAAFTSLSASAQVPLYFGTNGNGGSGTWDNGTTVDWATAPAGTSIVWANGDSAIFGTTAGTATIAAPITATGLAFNTTGYTVTFSGAVGTNDLTLTGTGPNSITPSNIALTGTTTMNAQLTGTTGLTTSGTGTLVLTTQTALTGYYTVGGTSTLQWGSAASSINLNSGRIVFVNSGATLAFDGNGNGTSLNGSWYGAGNLAIGSGTASLAAQYDGLNPAVNLLSGTTTINISGSTTWPASEIFVNSSESLSPNSVLNMVNGNLDFRTSGTLIVAGLTGTNAATDIGGDNSAQIITINLTSGTDTYAGVLENNVGGQTGGTFAVTKNGAGTEILSGANTYTLATTIEGGTLELLDATGTIATASAITGGAGSGNGTFDYDSTGASGAKAKTFTNLNFAAGETNILSTLGSASSNTLSFTNITRSAGGMGNFVTSGGTNGTTNKITNPLGNTGTSYDQGTFFGLGAAGGTYAELDNTGFIRAFNYATDGGTVTAGGATLGATTVGSQVETTGAITAQTTATVGTVQMAGATSSNTIVIGSGQTLTAGGVLLSGATGSGDGFGSISGGTLSGGVAVSNGTATDLVLATNQTGDVLTVSSTVADAGGGVTAGGYGTVILTGANTYTGNTYVAGGTLQIGNGTSGNLVAAYGGNFVVGGNLNFDLPAASTTYSGTVSGAGQLTQMANTVILNGTVSGFTGNVVVNSGATLQVGTNVGANTTANGYTALNTTINSGGTLIFDAGTSSVNLGTNVQISGAGNLQIGTGVGSLTTGFFGLTGVDTITGTTTIDIDGAGTWPGSEVFIDDPQSLSATSVLNMVNGNADLRANDTVAGITGTNAATKIGPDGGFTQTLTINQTSGTDTYAGQLVSTVGNGAATFSVVKSGAGTQILTGVNNYTGTTTVVGGKLLADTGAGTGGITASLSTVQGTSGSATLGGDGIIHGAVVNSFGILAPGDSTDGATLANLKLTTNAAVTLNTGATLSFVLNGATAGTQYSQLAYTAGGLTLNGTVNLALTLNYTPTTGTTFLLTNGSTGTSGIFGELNGSADSLTEGSTFTVNSTSFQITYLGGAGTDVELTVQAVPEPSSLALLGAGLVALLGWNVRRFRSKRLFP